MQYWYEYLVRKQGSAEKADRHHIDAFQLLMLLSTSTETYEFGEHSLIYALRSQARPAQHRVGGTQLASLLSEFC